MHRRERREYPFFIFLFKIFPLNLSEYIKDQLLFNESATLAGLGSFEINRVSSRIEGNRIIPPVISVVFNPDKTLDNGLLARSISSAEEITEDEAEQKILEVVDEIIFALNKGEQYVFPGFGILFRDSENIYRFMKDKDFQIDFEAAGLESFELDPFTEPSEVKQNEPVTTRESTDPKEPADENRFAESEVSESREAGPDITHPAPNTRSSRIVWILAGAAVVILFSFILVKYTTNILDGQGTLMNDNEMAAEDSELPVDEDSQRDIDVNSELGAVIDSMAMQENALAPEETTEPGLTETGPYSEYHIIAGSFADRVNAEVMQQALTEKGYPAIILQQGDKLYRVSAISFRDKKTGLNELKRFRENTRNNAAWLLSLSE